MEKIKQKIITNLEKIVIDCKKTKILFEELNAEDVQGIFHEDTRRILQTQLKQITNFVQQMGWELEITLINNPVLENIENLIADINTVLER